MLIIDNTIAKEIELGDIIEEDGDYYLITMTEDFKYTYVNLSDSTSFNARYDSIDKMVEEDFNQNSLGRLIKRKNIKLILGK